ncbi:hypothetical protein [Streptomyces lydicus]|uniref:hypothetical protein n=1 Tax=Streptomyces lydicus TaxID=47763 RepID=UPI00378AC0A8
MVWPAAVARLLVSWQATPSSTRADRAVARWLSEQLGERAWSAAGLGAAPDIDQRQRHIVMLEQELAEKRGELEERAEELEAARAANRS